MNPKLKQLHEEYTAKTTALQDAAKALQDAPDDISEDDLATLTATFETAENEADAAKDAFELFKRTEEARGVTVPDLDEDEEEPPGSARVTNEEHVYRRGGEHGIFHDLYRRDFRNDSAAGERLEKHQKQAGEYRVKRLEEQGREAFDLSSVDAQGGYLVAPIYLQDAFIDVARAGRTVVDAIGTKPLPSNTDTINVPAMETGVTVADQADNVTVSDTDATFGTRAAAVKTIAGKQDVPQQLVDRAVPGVDEVIFADLVKAYDVDLDTKVINSAVANNKGTLQVASLNGVTYTDASPTLAELYRKLADGIQQIHTGIFLPPTAIFMHPRRWAFCLAESDASNRPLVVPAAQNPQNAAGITAGVISQGPVGSIQGVPVYTDANIPANLGAGTNEDRIVVAHTPELHVWEDQGGPYLETFRDVGSGELQVRFRLHNYWAQMQDRRPKAISVVSGTGLVTPAF